MASYSLGDRVAIYLNDQRLADYLGGWRHTGTVRRHWGKGLLKVEIDGTASQDTEGNNFLILAHHKTLRKLRKKGA
jgi:hypothetical protein